MRVSTTFGQPIPERSQQPVEQSDPFRILVVGDFGSAVEAANPISIDRDDIDDVFKRLDVRIRLSLAPSAPEIEVALSEMDDFHPDRLFEQLELFASLRTRRRRLKNSDTFAAESAAIMAAVGSIVEPKETPAPGGLAAVDPSDLLSQALEQTELERKPVGQQIAEGKLSIDDYVRKLVEPYVVAKADPRQAEFIDSVDEAIAGTMRKLLHHPKFQEVEAAWLGIKMLVRRLETDSRLKLSILNLSKQQLADDVSAADDLSGSRLCKLLSTDDVPGADSWAVVLGNYVFDATEYDTDLLGRIARIHSAAGAAFIAAASPGTAGCADLAASADSDDWTALTGEVAERWNAVRTLPEACSVSLVLPGLLARLPYGKKSTPIDSFRFEELPDGTSHADYLWMNGAFGAVMLLGNAFSRSGWSVHESLSHQIDDLPICVYLDGTESVLKPCAEVELSLRSGGVVAQSGLTVLYSIRGQGSVRLPLIRSLSNTAEPLTGRWQ